MRAIHTAETKRSLLLLGVAALALSGNGLGVAQASAHVGPGRGSRPPAALDVQPFPGTPAASPQSEILFPVLKSSQLERVTVSGSRTGRHRGRLSALPGGHGTAFVPRDPFADGEHVSVDAILSSKSAGTASGAPNARRIAWSFAVRAPVAGFVAAAKRAQRQVRYDIRDPDQFTHSFYSERDVHPPIAWMTGKDPDPLAGAIFADAENSIQAGPLIFNPQGQLLYFHPLHNAAAFNVQVQRYQGQTVLTYFQGYVNQGVGIGRDVILDHHYQPVATVYAGSPYHADLHEFEITPQGEAIITAFAPVHADLRSVGGPRNGMLLDSIIQEIDIATGQVLWSWHAYGHIHLNASYTSVKKDKPTDFFHVNSVQQLPDGNLLVSSRNTWAIYEISSKTGRILQVIGGKHSYFKIGRGAHFEWQHHAQMQPDGTITVFDDASSSYRQSRALRLRLNYRTHRVTLVHAYTNHPPLKAASQGSVQALPDGNTFVGWGSKPYFTEFSSHGGRQLFSLHLAGPVQAYRGYRFPWWGEPTTPPNLALAATAHGTRVYASWNGATDVYYWRVLAGPSADVAAMTPVGQFRKTYFETKMWVPSTQPYFAVQALGRGGETRDTSAAAGR